MHAALGCRCPIPPGPPALLWPASPSLPQMLVKEPSERLGMLAVADDPWVRANADPVILRRGPSGLPLADEAATL